MMTNDPTNLCTGDEHINFHTRHVWTMMRSNSSKQPWELTMPDIHKEHTESQRKRFKVLGNLGPASMTAELVVESPMFNKCNSFSEAGLRLMRKTDELLWQQQMSMERKAAYKKWTSLVLSNPGCWTVARPRKGENLMDLLRVGIGESIKDCLGTKATGTLHNRANALIRFAEYSKENFTEPFPIKEHMVYQFLKSGDHAPTFPKSFLASVSFAKHTLGLMEADEVLTSCRVRGFSSLHFAKKRKLIQRPPLKVKQIALLEELVGDTHRTAYDRVAAGFFLFMTFGRLRYSDAQAVTELELEVPMGEQHGYLEGAAERCKTNTTLEKKTRLLPIVVPTKSFTEDGWVSQWLEVRAQSNMQVGSGIPLLPSPAAGGGWSKIPLSCEAAGDWLRALLKASLAEGSGPRVATHSCKASILSMCSKHGMEPAARRLLGYHSAGRDKSMLVYSRDTMSWPVRLLEGMLDDIKANVFLPDSTRSGYFPKGGAPSDNCRDEASSSSSCDSRDEDETNHTDEEQALESFTGKWGPEMPEEDVVYFRHKTSRCLHATVDESGLLFKCGRMVSNQYVKCQSKP